jgi:hypothetical protein
MRAVIAGLTPEGRSTIAYDGPPQTWMWARPAASNTSEPVDGEPPAGPGEVVTGRIFEFEELTMPSASSVAPGPSPDVTGPCRASSVRFGPNVRSGMHHDLLIGVGVIVAGRLEIVLEEGSATLEVGDAVVCPGVEHEWVTADEGATMIMTSVRLP